jgi:hypothetical protein
LEVVVKDLQVPSDRPIAWKVTDKSTGECVFVYDTAWCGARDAGARLLGVDRYAVTCERQEKE